MKRSSKIIGVLALVYALCLAGGGAAAADLWEFGELLKIATFLNLGLQVLVVIRLAEAERSRRTLEKPEKASIKITKKEISNSRFPFSKQ